MLPTNRFVSPNFKKRSLYRHRIVRWFVNENPLTDFSFHFFEKFLVSFFSPLIRRPELGNETWEMRISDRIFSVCERGSNGGLIKVADPCSDRCANETFNAFIAKIAKFILNYHKDAMETDSSFLYYVTYY